MVEAYQGLVRSIAASVSRRINRAAFDIDDLIGWGQIGLLEAAESYDESRKDFPSWAYLRIRGAMIDGMRGMDMFPRQLYEVRREMRSQTDELTASLGRHPEPGEIAESMGIPEDVYLAWSGRVKQMESLSYDANAVSDDFLVGIADSCDNYLDWECAQDVKSAIKLLRPRERFVLYYIYWAGLTQFETAEKLGINPTRVYQIKQDALRSLRERLARQ